LVEIAIMHVYAFALHQADGFVAQRRSVKGRPAARKIDDDFCEPLPIAVGPNNSDDPTMQNQDVIQGVPAAWYY
jgi:hypothetical protein